MLDCWDSCCWKLPKPAAHEISCACDIRLCASLQVAQQLLAGFLSAADISMTDDDIIHLEVHRWNNAYPLNPREPQAVAGVPDVAGAFMMEPDLRLVACGDW